MAFLTPAFIAGATAIAGTAATLTTTLLARQDAINQKEDRRSDALAAKAEEQRKIHLLESRSSRLRNRLASGSGQSGTILSGSSGSQGGVDRNVLLGQ